MNPISLREFSFLSYVCEKETEFGVRYLFKTAESAWEKDRVIGLEAGS